MMMMMMMVGQRTWAWRVRQDC